MKTKILYLVVVGSLLGCSIAAQAVDPVTLLISKAIKAIDLKVQHLQNETMVAQTTQRAAETKMSASKLKEINGWQDQFKTLYQNYYAELKQAKSVLIKSSTVVRILSLQEQVVVEYARMGKDKRVKPEYDELLNTSMQILETLELVIRSPLSMKDADRLFALKTLQESMAHCVYSIKGLNKRQTQMMASRTVLETDLQFVKKLYGIQ
ncbi:MAG: hypothetical protein K2X26_11040 [Chitinophagaceae bacterium]|jgi:hypothetical protein|nr:hypothetical protein [Chitinophagaceae bacterium]MCA6439308.1 hypothetical protein [Chitinophagaceae bacterium]MCA6448104.1 hypothetical protein [Chitinophagaceae bacterium]